MDVPPERHQTGKECMRQNNLYVESLNICGVYLDISLLLSADGCAIVLLGTFLERVNSFLACRKRDCDFGFLISVCQPWWRSLLMSIMLLFLLCLFQTKSQLSLQSNPFSNNKIILRKKTHLRLEAVRITFNWQ